MVSTGSTGHNKELAWLPSRVKRRMPTLRGLKWGHQEHRPSAEAMEFGRELGEEFFLSGQGAK